MFGAYGADVLDNLSDEARAAILAKDCKIKVNYVQETRWYTYNGGTLVDIDVTYTFSSETTISEGVGCGGGNSPPSGPGTGNGGSGGSTGSTTNGTNGPGVIVISTDPNGPNNRCIEDGVGCEEEEEDDNLVKIANTLDADRFPCAWEVVNELLGAQADATDNINVAINGIFSSNDQVNLILRSHPDLNAIPGVQASDANRGAFYKPGIARHDTDGNLFLVGEFFLQEDHIGCTKEFTRGLVMHEAIHGYIDYHRRTLSESDFQAQFPLYGSDMADPEHETMALQYVNNLSAVIRDPNQSISEFTVALIAWSGLQSTDAYSAWKNRMPAGLSPGAVQDAMDVITHASGEDCGNGLPNGETLSDYDFQTCN